MGKQLNKKPEPPKRNSTRTVKKKKLPSDQEDHFSQDDSDENSHSSDSEDDSNFSSSNSNSEEGSEESESTPQIDPANLAVRNMQFRSRRGTKMNALISRKKEEEEDPFWAAQGQNFFGNLEDGDNDEQDYVQSSSGRDQFDSDFDQTESEHEIQEAPSEKQIDEDYQRAKKKRQDLMRKIQAPVQSKKTAQKINVGSSAVKKQKIESQKKIVPESTSRYIHEMFNQEELLGQAATTEYFNWLSLKKLISLETEKKDFSHRSHHIEGPRVIYRNRFNQSGERQVTYQLSEVEAKNIQDLSKILSEK